MTLIAAIQTSEIAILIGDLLLTCPKEASNLGEDDIPTIGNQISSLELHFSVHSLVQKVNILNEDLMIAWSGNYNSAKLILAELKKNPGAIKEAKQFNDWIKSPAIQNLLNGVNGGLTLLGFVMNSDTQKPEIIKYSTGVPPCAVEEFESGLQGKLWLAGDDCGVDILENLCKTFEGYLSRIDLDSINKALACCASLYADEIKMDTNPKHRRNLFSRYGGGYEVAVSDHLKFKKLDNISYYTWVTHKDNNSRNQTDIFPHIMKVDYVEEILHISRIDLISKSRNEKYYCCWNVEVKHYLIPAINCEIPKEQTDMLLDVYQSTKLFESKYNCILIYPAYMKNGTWFPNGNAKFVVPNDKNVVQTIKEDNGYIMKIKKNYIDYLKNYINDLSDLC